MLFSQNNGLYKYDYNKVVEISYFPYEVINDGVITIHASAWCGRGNIYINNLPILTMYQNHDGSDAHTNSTSWPVRKGDILTYSFSGRSYSICGYFIPYN